MRGSASLAMAAICGWGMPNAHQALPSVPGGRDMTGVGGQPAVEPANRGEHVSAHASPFPSPYGRTERILSAVDDDGNVPAEAEIGRAHV